MKVNTLVSLQLLFLACYLAIALAFSGGILMLIWLGVKWLMQNT